MAGAWVRVGTVRSVNPAKRELRVDPARAFGKGAKLAQVRVTLQGGESLLCKVDGVNAGPSGAIVTLGAGVSRDCVARMKGASVDVERAGRRAAVPGEMDAADWIGLEVVNVSGARIGSIRGCIESRAHDILEIDTPGGTVLLPAIEQTVESVDLEARRVTVGEIAPYVIGDAD